MTTRSMNADDVLYRAYVKQEYFHMSDDSPYTMYPGPHEFTKRTMGYGPYTSITPARRALSKFLKGEVTDVDAARAFTEDYNKRMRKVNDQRIASTKIHGGTPYLIPLRDFYVVTTDYGIESVEPASWKRVEN